MCLFLLKSYMKAVKEHLARSNPDRVAAFEKGASAYAKKIVANFKDFEFVSGVIVLSESATKVTLTVHWRVNDSGRDGCTSQLPGTLWLGSHPHETDISGP